MLTQRTELDFKGQNFFVGIDVYLKSWTVTILTEDLMHKTFAQPARDSAGTPRICGNPCWRLPWQGSPALSPLSQIQDGRTSWDGQISR